MNSPTRDYSDDEFRRRALRDPGAGGDEFRRARATAVEHSPSRLPSTTTIAPRPMSISPAWSRTAVSGNSGMAASLRLPAQQGIPRPNRDTLYSFAIVDLDAGPVTIAQGHGIWVKTLKGHSGCDIMRRCSAFGLCLHNRDPDGIPFPDTPTPPGELPTAEATL